MRKKQGFTLIELLIVITIISILMGLIVVASRSVTIKAQIEGTRGTLMVLTIGCSEYHAVFRVYPDVTSGTTFANNLYLGTDKGPITDASEDSMREMNRRLRYVLMDTRVSNDPEIDGDVLVQGKLPKIVDDTGEGNEDNQELIVDSWGQFIRVTPGRDHTNDTPQGPNNRGADDERHFRILDMYSIGNNGIDDVNGNFIETSYNSNTGDDIVSWFIQKTKKGN